MQRIVRITNIFFFFVYFLASGGGSPLYPEFLQYYTMILQRPRIVVGDAGFFGYKKEPKAGILQYILYFKVIKFRQNPFPFLHML